MPTLFDMFSDDLAAVIEASSEQQDRRSPGRAMTEQDMVEHLTASGRYRILRKLEPRTVATSVRPEFPLNGVILDTETTGLSHRKEQIIEIGLIAFTFDEQGTIGDVTGVYGCLQQPTVSSRSPARSPRVMNDSGCSIHQDGPQSLIPGSRDTTEPQLAAGRVIFWRQPYPSCELATRFEELRSGCLHDQ